MSGCDIVIETVEVVWLLGVTFYLLGIARKIRNERRRHGSTDTV